MLLIPHTNQFQHPTHHQRKENYDELNKYQLKNKSSI